MGIFDRIARCIAYHTGDCLVSPVSRQARMDSQLKPVPTACGGAARREGSADQLLNSPLSACGAKNGIATPEQRRNLECSQHLTPREFSPAERQLMRVKTPPSRQPNPLR